MLRAALEALQLAAVRGLNQVVDRIRCPLREAEELEAVYGSGEGGGGGVDEDDDLAAAVLAVEGVRHVAGTGAGVAPDGAALLVQLLQAEPVGEAGCGGDHRLHRPQQVRAKEAAAQEG